jgi:hypothetical protein
MPYQGRSPQTGVRNRFVYTATASQTLFSGADSNGRTLRYEDGAYVDVFLNGVCLVPTSDFTATTKTSISLVSGAAASDVVEIVCYDIATMADTVSKSQGGTFDGSITVNGSFSADGGTIKLDGNYPTGTANVALGDTALDSLTSGGYNTAIGPLSLTANTSGSSNNALGWAALGANTTGFSNTAVGHATLGANTTGSYNTAYGQNSLNSNTTASNNTAVGYQAGYSSTTGVITAIGALAGKNYNTSGTETWGSTFVGLSSGDTTTTGVNNAALGGYSLRLNTTGSQNVALGAAALYSNTTASNNTAVGYQAGYSTTTSSGSVYVGYLSGQNTTSLQNTFVGSGSGYLVTSGQKNTIIGTYSGNQGGLDIRTSNNNIVLSDGDGNPRLAINNVGNTALYNANPSDDSPDSGIQFEVGSSNAAYMNIGHTTGTTSGWGYVRFFYGGSQIGQISQNGTTAVQYLTSSDYRLKENVVDLTGATDRLKQIPVHQFNFIGEPDRTVDGFLAHEVQAIVPEAIHGTKDEVDADGNPVYQGIDQSKLVPLLVATIKELEARITALEAN